MMGRREVLLEVPVRDPEATTPVVMEVVAVESLLLRRLFRSLLFPKSTLKS